MENSVDTLIGHSDIISTLSYNKKKNLLISGSRDSKYISNFVNLLVLLILYF